MYMEAILQDHHHNMSRVSLHRRSETPVEVDDIDNKFIKHNKVSFVCCSEKLNIYLNFMIFPVEGNFHN